MSERPVHRYLAAGGVVFDPANDWVLVLVRPGRPGPDGRVEIRLPKGHVEPGESHVETALREVYEESGLADLEVVADLGCQTVEFDLEGQHYVRDEFYFLMCKPVAARVDQPERQFRRLWLPWGEALARLTFEAEREWLRRAIDVRKEVRASEDFADDHTQ